MVEDETIIVCGAKKVLQDTENNVCDHFVFKSLEGNVAGCGSCPTAREALKKEVSRIPKLRGGDLLEYFVEADDILTLRKKDDKEYMVSFVRGKEIRHT